MRTQTTATAPLAPGGLRVFTALRHRNYRLYWIGFLLSIIGFQMQQVAMQWLAYDLTGSPLYLGTVGLASALPTIALTLFGGVVADRVNRRQLLLFTQAGLGLIVAAAALLVWLRLIEPWHLLALAFLAGAITAFDQPSRAAIVPHLVDRRDLMNAVALISVVWQSSRIVGPALAGVLIGFLGSTAPVFAIATLGSAAMVAVLLLLRLPRFSPEPTSNAVLGDLAQGLRFILGNNLFSSLIGMTFFNSVFGISYIIMLPVIAKDVLQVGPEGLGLMNTVSGIGALAGTFTVATLGDYRRKGWLLLWGGFAFGVGLVAFAVTPWFLPSLALLAFVGWCNQVYMTTTNTTLQAAVPDALRGRVMGTFALTYNLIPLGGLQAGAIATAFNVQTAIAFGGVLVAAFAMAAAVTLPAVRRMGEAEAG